MPEPTPPTSPRWMSRVFHALLVTILLVVVGFRVYRYFATSEAELATEQTPVAAQDARQLRRTASDAFRQEDWALAAEAYHKVLEEDPGNIRVRVRLAHALHSDGQYDSALNQYLFACRYDGDVRRWALYNIACVYALKGDKRLSLDYLSEAAEEGFRLNKPACEDPDLKSLVEDAEFQRLAELLKPVSQRDVYRRYDFLIGNWILLGEDGQRIGSLIVAQAPDGYALRGECHNDSRSSQITFFAYYDPETKDWHQMWLDDHGNLIQLHEEPAEDDSLVLSGHRIAADGKRTKARAIYTESKDGMTHLEIATTIIDGQTWQPWIRAALVPNNAAKRHREETIDSPQPTRP